MSEVAEATSVTPEAPVSGDASPESTENLEAVSNELPGPDVLNDDDVSAEAEAIEEEIKELKRKYNLKVNGKEKELEVDLNDENSVKKYLQKAMAADEKFQEAATLRKQMQALVETLKSNPLKILQHPELGIDVKELAEGIINRELEEELKTPEQKEREELESKLKEREDRLKEIEEKARESELARIQEQELRQIDDEISSALEANIDIPKSPYVVKRITDAMIDAMDMGYKDVSVVDVVPVVKEQLIGEIQEMFGSVPEDMLESVLENIVGKNIINKYRKKQVTRRKKAAPTASQVKDTGQKTKETAKNQKQEKIAFKDMFSPF